MLVVTFYGLFSFFFFSSRRRHTRFDCDWSSDVCSSDLDYIVDPTAANSRCLTPITRICKPGSQPTNRARSEEHTSELQSQSNLVCRLLLEKKTTHANEPSTVSASTAV